MQYLGISAIKRVKKVVTSCCSKVKIDSGTRSICDRKRYRRNKERIEVEKMSYQSDHLKKYLLLLYYEKISISALSAMFRALLIKYVLGLVIVNNP